MISESPVNRLEDREIDIYELVNSGGRYIWRHVARASNGAMANMILDSLRKNFVEGIYGHARA